VGTREQRGVRSSLGRDGREHEIAVLALLHADELTPPLPAAREDGLHARGELTRAERLADELVDPRLPAARSASPSSAQMTS
jgi:hypothetical protein